MSKFYRPQQEGQQFNGWKNGLNEVCITDISEMTGEELKKFIKAKSEREGREINKLDINIVITFKKKDYEYSKKMIYGYAFTYENGKINASDLKNNKGAQDYFRAYEMFDMLIEKPVGFSETGVIITEDGKEIKNLLSALKAIIKFNEYNFLAYMVKGDKYWNAKALALAVSARAEETLTNLINYYEKKQNNQSSYETKETETKEDYASLFA